MPYIKGTLYQNMKTAMKIILTVFTFVASYFFIYWVALIAYPRSSQYRITSQCCFVIDCCSRLRVLVEKNRKYLKQLGVVYLNGWNNRRRYRFRFRLFWSYCFLPGRKSRTVARNFLYRTYRFYTWIDWRRFVLDGKSEKKIVSIGYGIQQVHRRKQG